MTGWQSNNAVRRTESISTKKQADYLTDQFVSGGDTSPNQRLQNPALHNCHRNWGSVVISATQGLGRVERCASRLVSFLWIGCDSL